MPRNRRPAKLRRRVDLTLDDFHLRDRLRFLSGWMPANSAGTPWRTWPEYLADWNAVRDDVLERYRSGPKATFPEPFAATATRIAHEGGIAALDAMSAADIRNANATRDAR